MFTLVLSVVFSNDLFKNRNHDVYLNKFVFISGVIKELIETLFPDGRYCCEILT